MLLSVLTSGSRAADAATSSELTAAFLFNFAKFADWSGRARPQESGRMRFAVNVETARRSGVRLSSRLLDLAKIVRTDHGQ